MTDENSPEKSPWGWKALILFTIGGILFLSFFYLAVTNEPDYMPSQKAKQTHTAHQASSASEPTAAEMNMTESEHANMDNKSHGH